MPLALLYHRVRHFAQSLALSLGYVFAFVLSK